MRGSEVGMPRLPGVRDVRLALFGLFGLLAAAPIGCRTDADEAGPPTYNADIAPLLVERCGACHQGDGVGPFSVTDYETAKSWAEPMADAVEQRRMPPFFAEETDECHQRVPFADDPRLSDAETALLRAWVDAGAPEGDPADKAPTAVPEIDHIAEPDAIVEMPSPYTVDGAAADDTYRCFRIPAPNTTDVWLTEVEVLPGNNRVVHHAIVWNDPQDLSAGKAEADGGYPCGGDPGLFPTEILGVWTPGGAPTRTPEATGSLVHPGASLVLNLHYHPTGTTSEVDQTRIALKWRTDPPEHHSTWFLVDLPFGAQVQAGPNDRNGPEFRIPAGIADHQETVSLTIPPYLGVDLPVFAITPHMHYLGTEMLVNIRRPSADDECMVHVPKFRFDFQAMYTYDAPVSSLPTVNIGDSVDVRCTYDNSASNPFMPQHLEAAGDTEPQDVYWGQETGDEMCMAIVGLVLPPLDWLDLIGGF